MTTEVKTLTVEDVMNRFQVRRNSVYRWRRLGLLKTGVKEKGEWRFLTTEVERFKPPTQQGYNNVIRGEKYQNLMTTVESLLDALDDRKELLTPVTRLRAQEAKEAIEIVNRIGH